jgi:hypothetical protein
MRTDIFGLATRQHDMFGAPQESFDLPMTLDDMRAELRDALHELEASDTFPWSPTRATSQRIMFEEMANKLPHDDRDALMSAFNAELRRLRVIVD